MPAAPARADLGGEPLCPAYLDLNRNQTARPLPSPVRDNEDLWADTKRGLGGTGGGGQLAGWD